MPAKLIVKYFSSGILIMLLSLTSSVFGQSQGAIDINTRGRETRKLGWWTDARFGMFIHWGLYSLAAGEWNGEVMKGNGYAEQINKNMQIPNAEYEQLAEKFNPVNFNAGEWVARAARAGMKYIVITAKHQDGFAMFHSKASAYNIVDATPFQRDPISELVIAARKAGLGVGFYYSNARDYHVAGANWNTHGNTWDFPTQSEADFKAYYYGLVFDQVKELLTNYGKVDIMWFDVPYKITEQMSMDLKEHVLALQPDCIINGRIGNNRGDYLSMGDNAIPGAPTNKPWEACVTMNDTWGYSRHDNNWKDSGKLIKSLIECVSKGGNFLLNVGPTGLGIFEENTSKILSNIGSWMESNQGSIYNCTLAPADFKAPDGCMLTFNPEANRLYVHLMVSPLERLRLPGYKGKVKYARFLDDSCALKMESEKEDLGLPEVNEDLILVLPPARHEADIPVIELVLR